MHDCSFNFPRLTVYERFHCMKIEDGFQLFYIFT